MPGNFSRAKLGIGLGVFVLLISVFALIANHYYYSWMSSFTPFGCAYKVVGLKPERERLSELIDLDDLEAKIRRDPSSKSRISNYGTNELAAVTIIDRIEYKIGFQNTRAGGEEFTKVFLSASEIRGHSEKWTISNEIDSGMPDYQIKLEFRRVLAQLPITESIRQELNENIVVNCHPTTRLAF